MIVWQQFKSLIVGTCAWCGGRSCDRLYIAESWRKVPLIEVKTIMQMEFGGHLEPLSPPDLEAFMHGKEIPRIAQRVSPLQQRGVFD